MSAPTAHSPVHVRRSSWLCLLNARIKSRPPITSSKAGKERDIGHSVFRISFLSGDHGSKKKVKKPLFLIVMCVLCLSGPASAQSETDVPLSTEIGVGESAVSDAEIAARISGVLQEIGGYERVDVGVSSGVVTLQGEVLDRAAESELLRLVNRVSGVVAIENELRQSTSLEERLAPAWDRLMTRIEEGISLLPIILVALAAFLAIVAIGWTLTTRIAIWKRLAPNEFIADIYRSVARVIFMLIGIVIALDILNATALIGAVLGAAGVAGLALGFAVRDTVENFIASILLSLRQPFRPNDLVEIEGDIGRVARLTSRATILISDEGNHIRIPNSTVFKGRIVNFTKDSKRRFNFDLGVDADSDLAGAMTTATAAISSLPFVLQDPPVSAWISTVGDSNVVVSFAAWVDQDRTDFKKARGEAIRASKIALEHAGYGLPEPIYRIRLDTSLAAAVASADEAASSASVTTKSPSPDTKLPDAALPQGIESATKEAVKAERRSGGSDNLLVEGREQE
jgi:small-conductance mechanosensitive channel